MGFEFVYKKPLGKDKVIGKVSTINNHFMNGIFFITKHFIIMPTSKANYIQ